MKQIIFLHVLFISTKLYAAQSEYRYEIGLRYQSSTSLEFTESNDTATSSDTFNFNFDTSYSFVAGIARTNPSFYNYKLGLEYSQNIKLTSQEKNGTKTSSPLNSANLEYILTTFDMTFNISRSFILIGFNYCPQANYIHTDGNKYSGQGSLGGQAGLGINLFNNLVLEFLTRIVFISIDGPGTSEFKNLGQTTMQSSSAGIKITF